MAPWGWWHLPLCAESEFRGSWCPLLWRAGAEPLHQCTPCQDHPSKPACSSLQDSGPQNMENGKQWPTGRGSTGEPLCSTQRLWFYPPRCFAAVDFPRRHLHFGEDQSSFRSTCGAVPSPAALCSVPTQHLAGEDPAMQHCPRCWRWWLSGVIAGLTKGWSIFEPVFCCSWQRLAKVTLCTFPLGKTERNVFFELFSELQIACSCKWDTARYWWAALPASGRAAFQQKRDRDGHRFRLRRGWSEEGTELSSGQRLNCRELVLRVQKIELEWSCRCRESAGNGERRSGAVLELLPVVARMSYSVCATSLVSQGHVPELCPPVPICSIARSPQPRLCGTWEGTLQPPQALCSLGYGARVVG